MGKKLYKLLATQEQGLVEAVVAELGDSDAVHYQQSDAQLLGARIARLVGAFLESTMSAPKSFVEFVQRLTEERLAEGYYLHEIQTALNILDERACAIALEHSPQNKVDKHLLRITRTISLAKDQLAWTYCMKQQEAVTRVASLEQRLEQLEGGPDKD